MQQFIPYSFESTASKFYDNRAIYSYNFRTMAIIGARGIGKTYSEKRRAINRFIYHGEKFVFLRDNDEARKKLTNNNGDKFFADVKKEFKDFEGTIKGETIYINGDEAGYIMPSSTFQNYKGSSFEEIKTIIYDEFIPEKGRSKNAYQGYEFINMLYTIARTRSNVRVVLLANALDRGNEILADILGIKVNNGFGFYINREKGVICHYCDNNPKYNKDRDASVVGKLIKGTAYEENLFNNKFVDDESEFFEKKPEKLRLYCILHNQFNSIRVYIGMDGFFYVTRDFNEDTHAGVRFVNNIQDVNSKLNLIPQYVLEPIINGYNKSRFKFENANLKKFFINFIKRD